MTTGRDRMGQPAADPPNEAGAGVRSGRATYRICPRCGRSVAASTSERFCINDGEPLTERCPRCQAEIASPYAQFCAACGLPYSRAARPAP